MNFFEYFLLYYVQHIFGATYIITEITCCLAISLISNKIQFRDKKFYLRFFIDWVLTFLTYLFISCFFYFIFSLAEIQNRVQLRTFTWLIICFLHAFIGTEKRSVSASLTSGVISSTFIALTLQLSGCLGSYISESVGYPSSLLQDATLYFVMFILLGIIFLYKLISPFKYDNFKILSLVLINSIFILTQTLVIVFQYVLIESYLLESIILIFLYLVNVISFVIFYAMVKNYNALLDSQAKLIKSESENGQLKFFSYQTEEMHKLKHDLANQIQVMDLLYQRGEYEKMSQYFSLIKSDVNEKLDFVDTGNSLVTSIINLELTKARREKIAIETNIIISSNLGIEDKDLTSLITNVLDNAIEANSEAVDKVISFDLLQKGQYIFIKCVNQFSPTADFDLNALKTNKGDSTAHGYGIKIIKDICKKYKGSYLFKTEDSTFIFQGMLLNQRKSNVRD